MLLLQLASKCHEQEHEITNSQHTQETRKNCPSVMQVNDRRKNENVEQNSKQAEEEQEIGH